MSPNDILAHAFSEWAEQRRQRDPDKVKETINEICRLRKSVINDHAGMPIGAQLIAPAFKEDILLAISMKIQEVTDFHLQLPPKFS